MKTIKSTRAKEQIAELQEEYNPATIMDIIDVVEFAEKDAEERAVEAFEQWGDTWLNSLPCHIREVATNSYKELLNGGHSNEDN